MKRRLPGKLVVLGKYSLVIIHSELMLERAWVLWLSWGADGEFIGSDFLDSHPAYSERVIRLLLLRKRVT